MVNTRVVAFIMIRDTAVSWPPFVMTVPCAALSFLKSGGVEPMLGLKNFRTVNVIPHNGA